MEWVTEELGLIENTFLDSLAGVYAIFSAHTIHGVL
jgi:hypothetical protein